MMPGHWITTITIISCYYFIIIPPDVIHGKPSKPHADELDIIQDGDFCVFNWNKRNDPPTTFTFCYNRTAQDDVGPDVVADNTATSLLCDSVSTHDKDNYTTKILLPEQKHDVHIFADTGSGERELVKKDVCVPSGLTSTVAKRSKAHRIALGVGLSVMGVCMVVIGIFTAKKKHKEERDPSSVSSIHTIKDEEEEQATHNGFFTGSALMIFLSNLVPFTPSPSPMPFKDEVTQENKDQQAPASQVPSSV